MSEKEFNRKMDIERLFYIFYTSIPIITLDKLLIKAPIILLLLKVVTIFLLVVITLVMIDSTYDELNSKIR